MAPSQQTSGVLSFLISNPIYLFTIPLALVVFQTIQSYRKLAHIPGPLSAKLTNISRLSWVLSSRAHDIHTNLHRQYGPLVRFGPNMVSCADPREVSHIYPFVKPWRKSDFYTALLMKPRGKPIPGIFAAQDEAVHKALKKPISNAYSMSTLVTFEPYVDTTMNIFCDQLRSRFVRREGQAAPICDFGQWLQMFAFDVIGELTFSKRLGFLENGKDVNNLMGSIWNMFKLTSLGTQMSFLDRCWINSPLKQYMRTGVSPAAAFAVSCINERREIQRTTQKNDWNFRNRDFLSRFMEIEAKDETTPPYAVASWASSNITAGSDTTGIFLRTLFYNLLTKPSTLKKLMIELDTAAASENLDVLASWKQTHDLPYLDACVKEAGRIHPPFGLPYERVVPPEGAMISGHFIPGGTIVGMSAWATHRNKELYGDDCDDWNPDRWLCEPAKRREMENSLLTFGAGNRTCMGKYISYLEIYKVVPTLLRQFEFELVQENADDQWRVENRWFVMQFGFHVRVKERNARRKD